METIRQMQKRICSRAMLVAIVLALGLILAGFKPQGKGLVLGTLFSVVNFVVLGRTLPWRLGKSRRRAIAAAFGSMVIRLALMAVPLAAAMYWPGVDVIAVVAGLFMVQGVIMADHLIVTVTADNRPPG